MNNKLLKPFVALSAILKMIFGQFQWDCPPWWRAVRQQARVRPLVFVLSVLGSLCILTALISAYFWYQSLPKPEFTQVDIKPPIITPLEEPLTPGNLVVDFSKPVAPLASVGKQVENIGLSPDMAGTWHWETDKQLVFIPQQDWPAAQTFQVRFSPESLTQNAALASMSYSFTTQGFAAELADLSLYQDPAEPAHKQIVATIKFNFPVRAESLEENTALYFAALKDRKINVPEEAIPFHISYDKSKRLAYIRSEDIHLPDIPRFAHLVLAKGIAAENGPGVTPGSISSKIAIPDASSYLQVTSLTANIIRNEHDTPEQVLNVETSLGISEMAMNKSIHIYRLPQNYPATAAEEEKKNYSWHNPGEVTAYVLALSKPLTVQPIPPAHNFASLHSYRFTSATPQYLFIKIDKGMQAFGGYRLAKDYRAVVAVPALPQEIRFLHKGALLALTGDKMLSILTRGLPAVKFEIARVLPANVNQLITQTQGDFNNPYFINESFNEQNISTIASEIQQFDTSDPAKQQYTSLDLGHYLGESANGPRGLFLLKATGWDLQQQEELDVKARRLILITDLALIVKNNSDGTHDVFVQSISSGSPVANTTVSVLGKNGLPIMARQSDENGKTSFPVLTDYNDDREPVAYLVQQGDDVSFIPYDNSNRQLNFSRFDIGGLYNTEDPGNLCAFIFTDRGIYRPGDKTHVGLLIKQAFANNQPGGLPLEVTVVDPRGTTVYDQKFSLDPVGYSDFDFATTPLSPTGQYQVNVYIVKDDSTQNLLGSANFRVAEFLPDRMKISTQFNKYSTVGGWVSPEALSAKVYLHNLYGAPAANHRISAKLLLSPQAVQFPKFADYVFHDPLQDGKKPAKVFTETLDEKKTDEQGEADFPLNLGQYGNATYQLSFFAEGFEAGGGRSVTAQATTLVSPLTFLVGYKTDGDLHYIKQNGERSLHFIAISPQLEPIAQNGLKAELVALQPVATLVKMANGSYEYQSIVQSTVLKQEDFTIPTIGVDFSLPTNAIGDFSLRIVDAHNTLLSEAKFTVVGASQQPLAKNAELNIHLNKDEYQAGEEVELQINAPYTGAGLITIERDKVYAAQWFKAEGTSSLQKIRIPVDFQGNGYVNVAFVRNWDSPEIFINPLSYAVVPFKVSHDDKNVKITLDAAPTIKPGNTLDINYQSDKPAKIIIFAVDEGILQVSRYATPDPLGFFFQKRALQVITQQTVDQILPKFILARELSAAGGDDGEAAMAGQLNPFKRKTDLPVVFWSGLVESNAQPNSVHFPIPDYFNGSLRIMAVAATENGVGSAEKDVKVKGDFIIYPNVPTFVAPGDEFTISASIANNVPNSGKNADVSILLETSPGLELIDNKEKKIMLDEGKEGVVRYRLRAKELLGNATLRFKAQLGTAAGAMQASLSIRPASPSRTEVHSGQTTDQNIVLPVNKNFYKDLHQISLVASTNPVILVNGLQRYLDNYPYGCTEQLVSKAWPLLAMANQPWQGENKLDIQAKIRETVQMLGQRQMTSGAFSYWPNVGDNSSNDFASVYAMHFLTTAKEQGYYVAPDLISNGIDYLKEIAQRDYSDFAQGRIQAYAIYLLTRNEIVTSDYLTNLVASLEHDKSAVWRQDITGAYIAASYQLLQNTDAAADLIKDYKMHNTSGYGSDFYTSPVADAQYLYLVAQHFPLLLDTVSKKLLPELVESINIGDINTVLSSYVSLALNAIGDGKDYSDSLSLFTITGDNKEILIPNNGQNSKPDVDLSAKAVKIENPKGLPFFYQLTQTGFPKDRQTATVKGLEVFREYRDDQGNAITKVKLGEEIEVHIQLRTLDNRFINNLAVVDLLPGGFEVVRDSIKAEGIDYYDIREDRVLFFGSIGEDSRQIVYRIKATNAGRFIAPAVMAECMYDPSVLAIGNATELQVLDETDV